MPVWGATPDDWFHFDLILGLTADLLPVVSNPEAEISPLSRMKDKGKTPSIYNRQRQVAGIPKWTDKQTTPKQIERWSQEGDYGICIQTRHVRALDVDVPDVSMASRISRAFERFINHDLPVRQRSGTGKMLLAFALPGDFSKRSFRVEGGLVEFLATGQQFVAVGTHPDGSRYEWAGGLPTSLPELTPEQFEAAWAAIVEEFATEPERRAQRRQGAGADLEGVEDDVAEWLVGNWPTFGSQGGKLFVLCPWKEGHSSDSGETEAAWLLAGTGGYAQGHFECLHASCAGRSDVSFLDAVGYRASLFEDLTADGGALGRDAPSARHDRVLRQDPAGSGGALGGADTEDAAALYAAVAGGSAALGLGGGGTGFGGLGGLDSEPLPEKLNGHHVAPRDAPHEPVEYAMPLPGFLRDRQGRIEAVIENVVKAVASRAAVKCDLRFDAFRAELMLREAEDGPWRPFKDADAVELRVRLAAIGFKPVSRELMRDACVLVAERNRMDTAVEWLESLPPWDGVERIARFYPHYFRTADTEYTRAVGEYVWTAHAGRIMDPGCKADMVPIVIGDQGCGKSTGIAAISPADDFFAEIDLAERDADLSRKLRGLLVGELGELRGLRTRKIEEIKVWVAQRFERWTPKYMEANTVFPRRLVLHGSGNDRDIFSDPTGERRWLPMECGRVDFEAIRADRDQLWAEGLARWREEGVLWARAQALAVGQHEAFRDVDVWQERVAAWLFTPDVDGRRPVDTNNVTTGLVLEDAVGIDPSRISKNDQMRANQILTTLGLERVVRWVNGKARGVWNVKKRD